MDALLWQNSETTGSNKDEYDTKERNTKKVKDHGKQVVEDDGSLHKGNMGGITYKEMVLGASSGNAEEEGNSTGNEGIWR
ncbi:unnamed protein product [Lathyrus sativus]|nr:unnamed protein product [Lathyrus sativus]